MKPIVAELVGKKASDLSPDFKINCFTTVISYFNNQIQDGKTSAQAMLDWLRQNTTQTDKIVLETVIVVWSSSNPLISPDKIKVVDMVQTRTGYPFGLVMEHAAVFISGTELFQKASPNDDDKFEVIHFTKMINERYHHLPWMRITFHNLNRP